MLNGEKTIETQQTGYIFDGYCFILAWIMMKIVDCRMMVTRVHNISRSAQSIYSKSDMFVLPPMRSRSSMRRAAGFFLNERILDSDAEWREDH